MKPQVKEFESLFMSKKIPKFGSGDTLQVSFRVREGDKERIQVFQGVVIGIKGQGINKTVTMRKVSGNIAVERIFPLHSPVIAKIKRTQKGSVRRARLYYLRGLQGKAARIKEERKGLSKAILVPQEPTMPEEAVKEPEEVAETTAPKKGNQQKDKTPEGADEPKKKDAPKKEPAAKEEKKQAAGGDQEKEGVKKGKPKG